METKSFIRKDKLTMRNQMNPEVRLAKSFEITQKVLGLSCVQKAESVLCYASYQSEVSTIELIKELLRLGKNVYLPRVNGEEMDFYHITGCDDLAMGYKGIPEPSLACRQRYENEIHSNTVMIMPGCAFSKDGSRIGYGKGYYDRYLERNDIVERVALCFSLQMVDHIPSDIYDKKASFIITENEVIECSKYNL